MSHPAVLAADYLVLAAWLLVPITQQQSAAARQPVAPAVIATVQPHIQAVALGHLVSAALQLLAIPAVIALTLIIKVAVAVAVGSAAVPVQLARIQVAVLAVAAMYLLKLLTKLATLVANQMLASI
jgi:hypothetical protein